MKPTSRRHSFEPSGGRVVFEKDIVRAKRNFGRGMTLMGISLLLLGVIFVLFQHRDMDIFGWVLVLLMAACPLIGLVLAGLSKYVRCPGCRERVVLARGGCGDFCQTCGGQIARHDTSEGLFRRTTYQCSGCGVKPRSQQCQNIGSIHHCPHCGLKLQT